MLEHHADERMAALMVCRQALFFFAHDVRLALRTCDDALDGFFHLRHADLVLVAAGGEQCRLIDEVREVRTRKARRAARNDIEVDILCHRLALRVDLEDGQTAAHIGLIDDNLAVEAARAQERRVEDIRAVRRRDDDDALVGRKAVHLDEQLVERLLALIVAATDASATLASDCIDLIDEDDARRILLRLLEEVADTRSADTDEHLDEVRARNREERYTRLACDSACEQRLTGARRAEEQDALRDAGAELVELLRVLEELDDFLELLLRLIRTGDIAERDLDLVGAAHARAALAERHDASAAALRLLHDEEPDADEQQDGDDRREHLRPPGRLRRILRRDVDSLRRELLVEVRVIIRGIRRDGRELRAICERAVDRVLDDHDFRHIALVYLLQELRVLHFLAVRVLRREVVDDGDCHQDDEQIEPYIA